MNKYKRIKLAYGDCIKVCEVDLEEGTLRVLVSVDDHDDHNLYITQDQAIEIISALQDRFPDLKP